MAKRELIDTKKLIRKMNQSNGFDISERIKFSNLIDGQRPVTEQEIVKPYLDKIRAEIDKARFIDKDTRICKNALASGLEVAMHIIDKCREESEE